MKDTRKYIVVSILADGAGNGGQYNGYEIVVDGEDGEGERRESLLKFLTFLYHEIPY